MGTLVILLISMVSFFLPIAFGVWAFIQLRNIRREIAELRLEVQDALRSRE